MLGQAYRSHNLCQALTLHSMEGGKSTWPAAACRIQAYRIDATHGLLCYALKELGRLRQSALHPVRPDADAHSLRRRPRGGREGMGGRAGGEGAHRRAVAGEEEVGLQAAHLAQGRGPLDRVPLRLLRVAAVG